MSIVQMESSSSNMMVATATPPSSSCMYTDSKSVYYGDEKLVHTDMKPTVESTDMAVQRWTPSKRLTISPSKTPSKMMFGAVKTEVCSAENFPFL